MKPRASRYPRYRLSLPYLAGMLTSFLTLQHRDFHADALVLTRGIQPPLKVHGAIPQSLEKGFVVLVNHYNRPGFQAWWIALSVSALLDLDLHWVITSGWVYDDPLRSMTITPLSRFLLRRIAFSYGFTSMPAMPPRIEETEQRAAAVLSLLKTVRCNPGTCVGLAPEGFDSEGGELQRPPQGVGRLLAILSQQGHQWLPVGIYEEHGSLNAHFGPITNPVVPERDQADLDRAVADVAMVAIAKCLPERLRGPYANL